MQTVIDLGYDDWIEIFKPHCDKDGSPIMYETYGDDYDYIADIENEYLWTWVDGGDYSVITNGFHYVNRMGYYVCETACPTEDTYEVDISEPECERHSWVDHKMYDGSISIICEYCERDYNDFE